MKIQSINFVQQQNRKQKIQNSISQNSFEGNTRKQVLSNIPTKNYLAFLGGASLDLASTLQSLPEDSFPLDIRENALEELNKGNPERKTLNDIHFEKYSGVLDCFSLDELKEKYPEFSSVKSSYELDAKQNSTLDRFKQGKSQIFPFDEDLSLQLVKLYWGRGFSLNDISKYISQNAPEESKNLHYLINGKLNIPLMDNQYARMLKLSNREYNEKFTSELGQKIKDAKEMAQQKETGEPVFIPRRPLTEAHKEHISQSLIKYYEAHPEKPYELSQIQKEYFKNNPEQAKKFSEALDYAWNRSQDGRSVKKKMTKFINKFFTPTDDELSLKKEMSEEKKNALKEFWGKNTWAKEKFSKALQDGWKYAKFDFKEYMIPSGRDTYVYIPDKVLREYFNSTNLSGENVEFLKQAVLSNFSFLPDKDLEVPQRAKYDEGKRNLAFQLLQFSRSDFLKSKMKIISTSNEYVILELANALFQNDESLPSCVREDDKKRKLILNKLESLNEKVGIYKRKGDKIIPTKDIQNNRETQSILPLISDYAASIDCGSFGGYMNDVLESAYEELSKGNVEIFYKFFDRNSNGIK